MPLNHFIAAAQDATYSSGVILMTQSELLELVEELRGMAAAAPTAKVRDALTRMADRYAARAAADASRRFRSTDNIALLPQQSGNRPWGSIASNAPAS